MIVKPRTWSSVLLAVVLVFCQQVGFAHALTHFGNPHAPRPTRSDTQHPADKACTECVMFAQLGAGLPADVPQVAVQSPQFVAAAMAFRVFDPAQFFPFRSRAPPLPLQ